MSCFLCYSQFNGKSVVNQTSTKILGQLLNSPETKIENIKDEEVSLSCQECFGYLSEAQTLFDDIYKIHKRLEELKKIITEKIESRSSAKDGKTSEKNLNILKITTLKVKEEVDDDFNKKDSQSDDDDTDFEDDEAISAPERNNNNENDKIDYDHEDDDNNKDDDDDAEPHSPENEKTSPIINSENPILIQKDKDTIQPVRRSRRCKKEKKNFEELPQKIKRKTGSGRPKIDDSKYLEKLAKIYSNESTAIIIDDVDCDRELPEPTYPTSDLELSQKPQRQIQNTRKIVIMDCEKCEMKFTRKQKYLDHLYKVHKIGAFKCTEPGCDMAFKLEHSIKKHLAKVHKKEKLKYPCHHCTLEFYDEADLKNHLNYFLEKLTISYKCSFPNCDKKYVKKIQWRKHLRTHDPDENLICDECGSSYKGLHILKAHKKNVHCEKKFICTQCPFKSHYKYGLENHVKRTHNSHNKSEDVTDSYVCEICAKGCQSIQSLKTHIKRVHASRNFACNFEGCEKKFKCNEKLKRHKIWHRPKDQRPYKCKLCQKTFGSQTHLNIHLTLHGGEKNSICDFPNCKMAFTHYSYLKLHKWSVHKKK